MSLVIRKFGSQNFTHETAGFEPYSSSDMVFVFDGNFLKIRSENGRIIFSRDGFRYNTVTVYDVGGSVEVFTSVTALQQRLIDLGHPAYNQGGGVIPGDYVSRIVAGTNVTIDPPSGTGTVTVNSTGSGGGANLEKDVNQTAHGFSAGNVVRLDGANYVLAQADAVANANAISFVTEVVDADNFKIQSESYISVNLGLSNGDEAFLSTTVAGGVQTTEPANGEVNVYLGQQTPQGFLISISTGFVVGSTSGGGEPTTGLNNNGSLSLTNLFGTYYNDYNVSSGTLSFSISNDSIGGYAYFKIVGDGLTPFASQSNLDSIFSIQTGIPSLVLSASKHIFTAWRDNDAYGIAYLGTDGTVADTTPPTVTSFTVEDSNPDLATIVFSEDVIFPNVLGLSLSNDFSDINLSNPQGSLSTWTLDLSRVMVNGETGDFVYDGTNTITDSSSNPLAASNTPVTNNVLPVDITPPVISGFSIPDANPNRIIFDSSEIITASTFGGFTLGSGRVVTGITINSGQTTGHYFTVNTSYVFSDGNDTISYSGSGSDIQDSESNALSSFTATTVTNNISDPGDVTPPTVISATIENANPSDLVVVFSENVIIGSTTGLSLDGDWISNSINNVTGAGTNTLIFELATPALNGESGNFVYSVSNTIQDTSFNSLLSGSTTITNNVSGGQWQPSDLGANLMFELDASDASTITTNSEGNVTQFRDKTSNNFDFNATLGSEPTWNGVNKITFNSLRSEKLLCNNTTSLDLIRNNTQGAFAVRIRKTVNENNTRALIFAENITGGGVGEYIGADVDDGNLGKARVLNNSTSSTTTTESSSAIRENVTSIIFQRRADGTFDAWFDGVKTVIGSGSGEGWFSEITTLRGVVIGELLGFGNGDLDFYKALCVDREITDQEASDITNWLEDGTTLSINSCRIFESNDQQLVVKFDGEATISNINGLSLDGTLSGVNITGVNGSGTDTLVFSLDASVTNGLSGNFVFSASNTIVSNLSKSLPSGTFTVDNRVGLSYNPRIDLEDNTLFQLDASNLNSIDLDASNNVTEWRDEVGQYAFTNNANGPLYNGSDMMTFNASNSERLTCSLQPLLNKILVNTKGCIGIKIRKPVDANNTRAITFMSNGGRYINVDIDDSGSGGSARTLLNGGSLLTVDSQVQPATALTTIIVSTNSGSDYDMWIDGVKATVSNSSTPSGFWMSQLSSLDFIDLGFLNISSGFYGDVEFYKAVYIDKSISDDEAASINDWLES